MPWAIDSVAPYRVLQAAYFLSGSESGGLQPVVRVDERHQLLGERIRAEPEIRRLDVGLLAQLIAAFFDGKVRGAVADEPDPGRPRHFITEPGIGYRWIAGEDH